MNGNCSSSATQQKTHWLAAGSSAKERHPVQHPTSQRACGRCGLPAVYRVALVGLDESPTVMLARRSHYRCTEHLLDALAPAAMRAAARNHQRLVIDPAFTASRSVSVSS